jgi:hypothetical protein
MKVFEADVELGEEITVGGLSVLPLVGRGAGGPAYVPGPEAFEQELIQVDETLVQVYESRRADLAADACGVLDRLVRAVGTLAELVGNQEPDALEVSETLAMNLRVS